MAACSALWTREDSYILLLLLPCLTIIAWQTTLGDWVQAIRHAYGGYGMAVFWICFYVFGAATLIYRQQILPPQPPLHVSSALIGFAAQIKWAFSLAGSFPKVGAPADWGYQTGSRVLELFSLVWGLALAGTTSATLLGPDSRLRKQMSVCFIAAFVSCLPGLVAARGNLLFVPTTFIALAVGISIANMWRRILRSMPRGSTLQTVNFLAVQLFFCQLLFWLSAAPYTVQCSSDTTWIR